MQFSSLSESEVANVTGLGHDSRMYLCSKSHIWAAGTPTENNNCFDCHIQEMSVQQFKGVRPLLDIIHETQAGYSSLCK